MKKIAEFLKEHLLAFVIGAISLISLVLFIIVFIFASEGAVKRTITIEDITGSAFILKSDGQVTALKKMRIQSGDVLITSADSTLKLAADKNKYIYIEPETTLYITYTDTAEKGSIIVNISEGAAVTRLDSKMPRNGAFEVRTPNAVVSAKQSVFRTEFRYHDTYMGKYEVKLTDVQCADRDVEIQLYDNASQPCESLMKLSEGKSARLMTSTDTARYEYLNYDTDLSMLSEDGLKTYIKIAAERGMGFSLSSLNSAYQNGSDSMAAEQQTTLFPSAESTEPSEATVTTTAETTVTTVTTVTSDVTSSETNPDSLSSESTVSETTPVISAVTTDPTTVVTTVPSSQTTVTTESTPILVTSPTSAVYTVSTTTETTTFTTAAPSETAVTSQTTIPPIVNAETATQAPPAATTAPAVTEAPPQETTKPSQTRTTTPWWEIINSAALTSSDNQ